MSDHPMSNHPFGNMSDRDSSQQRREETFPLRTALPARERSREEIELAQQLLGHSQGGRDVSGDSPSPRYDAQRPPSTSPSVDRLRQATPGSATEEVGLREQSFAPMSSQSDTGPSGQVCRYVVLARVTGHQLTVTVIVEQVEHRSGDDLHRELLFATLVVFT